MTADVVAAVVCGASLATLLLVAPWHNLTGWWRGLSQRVDDLADPDHPDE